MLVRHRATDRMLLIRDTVKRLAAVCPPKGAISALCPVESGGNALNRPVAGQAQPLRDGIGGNATDQQAPAVRVAEDSRAHVLGILSDGGGGLSYDLSEAHVRDGRAGPLQGE